LKRGLRLAAWAVLLLLSLYGTALLLGPHESSTASTPGSASALAPRSTSAGSQGTASPAAKLHHSTSPSTSQPAAISAATSQPTPVATVPPATPTPAPTPTAAFLTVSGGNLTYRGQLVVLRGENFENCPAGYSCVGSSNISKIDVNEADYAKVSSLGGNHVRFGLDYAWWSTNRSQFYAVLDQHVAWAKAHHIWMIPVMFSPPGGSNGGYGGQSGFWGNAGNQQALTNFWVDFARHYANEPTIAGYDLFNEPAPPSAAAWAAWAQTTINATGGVDSNHFIAVEASSADWNLPAVSGARILWSAHCYAAVGTNGCNYPGSNPRLPPKRPYWVGEVGSTYPNLAYVPANLASFNQNGVSWSHYDFRHGCGAPNCWGLYQNWNAGDFSSAWTAMINAVSAAMAGSIKP
jgi:hypothetical protein